MKETKVDPDLIFPVRIAFSVPEVLRLALHVYGPDTPTEARGCRQCFHPVSVFRLPVSLETVHTDCTA